MKTFFKKSIRNRLIIIIFSVSVLTLLIGFTGVAYLDIQNIQRDLKEDALMHARFTGQNCIGVLEWADKEGAQALLNNLEAVHYIQSVALYDAAGLHIAAYNSTGNRSNDSDTLNTTPPEDGFLHVIEPIYYKGLRVGAIHLKASFDDVRQRIGDYLLTLAVILTLTTALALVLASRLQGLISKPILNLADVTRHISKAKDYSVRASHDSEDEIGVLYTGFNDMINQVAARETERDAAELALRESEERFRSLVETSSDWIWEVDTDWKYRYVSPKVRELLGYEPEELIGQSPFDFMAEEDAHTVRSAFMNIIELKQPITGLQNRNIHKAGHIVVLETNGVPVFNEQGKITGYRGIDRNITDRRRAQEALQRSEQKYRTLFTSINDPILIYNQDTQKIIDCNQPALDRYAYTIEELRQMTPAALLEPGQEKQQAVKTAKPHAPQHYRHITKHGQPLDVEIISAPLIYHEQTACMSIIRDISDRMATEKALRHTKNYLKNILNSMPSVIVGVDHKGQITQWNLEAQSLTGLATENVLGASLDAVLPDLQLPMDLVLQAIHDKEILKRTTQANLDHQGMKYLDITVYPLITHGREGAVIRLDDVSERIRIEEMMIQSEKMLSVGGLAAGMAHEINNPLAGIMQNVQVIRNRLFGDLPANHSAAQESNVSLSKIQNYMHIRKIAPMIDAVMESGQRAAQIVENMLSFSRKSDSKQIRHNLVQLLDQTLELAGNDYDLKKKYDFKRIKIIKSSQKEMPLVRCEPSKIQQVILNILKNGAQAMGISTVDNAPAEFILNVLCKDQMACIEITDNGPGMDEETRRRVFEPFFTTKTVGVGTGLGLSVSYFIVTENHRGQLKVNSAPGQGSTFIIELPLETTSI